MAPTRRPRSSTIQTGSRLISRAQYTRTAGDMLLNDPDGWMSDGVHGPVWWYGLDSGGGATPIGPNGPFATTGPALPIVTRATGLITGPLTAVPFREIDLADGHPLGRARWVTDPMLLRPDSRFVASVYPAVSQLARSVFWAGWIRAAIWYGLGAFITQLDDSTAQPLAGSLRLVNPLLLSTERDSGGVLRWVLGASTDDSERAVFDRDGFITLGPITYRLVVLRNPHSAVDAEGMSQGVFAQSPQAFRLEGQVASYTSGTFRSGIPAGYLKVLGIPNMAQEQADELRASWLAHHGGDRRSIGVLSSSVDFVPLNLSPVDAALGEVRRLSIADVAYAFGLSPDNLSVSLSGSATYSNVRDHFQDLKDFGLAPWIAAVEDTLTALLPGSQGIRVNLDGFANPPASERMATYKTAIEIGVYTEDECRALEGLPPLPPKPKPQVPPQLQAAPDDDGEDQPQDEAS